MILEPYVSNDGIKITNPVQLRAFARALAWMGSVQKVEDRRLRSKFFSSFRVLPTGEVRTIARYKIVAERNKPYLLDVRAGQIVWHPERIPAAYADNEEHELRVTFVWHNGQLRVSRANQPWQYTYFDGQQREAGITREHPDWIHPYDRLTKDAIISMLLDGMTFNVNRSQIIHDFYTHELLNS